MVLEEVTLEQRFLAFGFKLPRVHGDKVWQTRYGKCICGIFFSHPACADKLFFLAVLQSIPSCQNFVSLSYAHLETMVGTTIADTAPACAKACVHKCTSACKKALPSMLANTEKPKATDPESGSLDETRTPDEIAHSKLVAEMTKIKDEISALVAEHEGAKAERHRFQKQREELPQLQMEDIIEGAVAALMHTWDVDGELEQAKGLVLWSSQYGREVMGVKQKRDYVPKRKTTVMRKKEEFSAGIRSAYIRARYAGCHIRQNPREFGDAEDAVPVALAEKIARFEANEEKYWARVKAESAGEDKDDVANGAAEKVEGGEEDDEASWDKDCPVMIVERLGTRTWPGSRWYWGKRDNQGQEHGADAMAVKEDQIGQAEGEMVDASLKDGQFTDHDGANGVKASAGGVRECGNENVS